MGIFSKFQIKDIKTKILGGKSKHKSEVPSIAVSPPTPNVHEDFTFPQGERDNVGKNSGSDSYTKNLERKTLIRQRSASLPELLDDSVDFHLENKKSEITKTYLKPPKSTRKRRRRGRRTVSCPGNLSKILVAADSEAKGCENNLYATGPSENTNGYYGNKPGDIGVSDLPQLESENQEFGKEQRNIKPITSESNSSCYELGLDNAIFRNDSISSALSTDNGVSNSMDASPSAEEFKPLCLDSDQQSEKSETFSNTDFNEKIQRRVFSSSERRKPDARWSLDLEKLGCSGSSLLSEDGDMKWDGQNSKSTQENKNLASTWSLDLEKQLKIDHSIGRAYSEINFSGSPKLRGGPESLFSEKVIFNAKSLDLEFVKPETGNAKKNSDSTLQQPVLKRGISDYVGKFNGIVSKFSTWSLDIDSARKRSLEKDLDEGARAQSEMALGAYKDNPENEKRALSYHSLLYDFDEASRYQIYQPTVYEIADQNPTQNTDKNTTQNPKVGTYGNSMKFFSKQLEHLYENGKSLYKHRHVIIDAIKQREKELKAIADKDAKAKQAEAAHAEAHKFFKPKPKPPPRRRSTSHKKHVEKVLILPQKLEGTR